MKRADFFAALHTAAPCSTPEAVQKWIDFAAECVSEGQYANFTPSKDQEADVENWLDTLCGGVYAVRAEYGAELAGKLVGLSLNKCCLYPGEMLQAAECLRDGGTAETISGKIASDEIESEQPFFPVPVHPLTERDCGPDILIREREVPCGMWDQRMEPGYILWNGTVLLVWYSSTVLKAVMTQETMGTSATKAAKTSRMYFRMLTRVFLPLFISPPPLSQRRSHGAGSPGSPATSPPASGEW